MTDSDDTVRTFKRVRRPFTARIEIAPGQVQAAGVIDIGLGGMRLRIDEELQVGSLHKVWISLQDQDALPATARVVRSEAGRTAAFQFVDMSASLFDALDRLEQSDDHDETKTAF